MSGSLEYPNRHDWLAGIIALLILGAAFLIERMPIFGVLITVGFLTSYRAWRLDDIKHAAVVAGLCVFVLAAAIFIGTLLSVVVTAILAVLLYRLWYELW